MECPMEYPRVPPRNAAEVFPRGRPKGTPDALKNP